MTSKYTRPSLVRADEDALTEAVGSLAEASSVARSYTLHGRAVRVRCVRLLGDAASADDATQEVFLRLHRARPRVPPPEEMRPWLLRVATNYCLNELRRRQVRSSVAAALADAATANLEDAMVARSDVQGLLTKLSPRARATTWLTYVDGMLQHEVAVTLGVSRRTVVNDLNRLRAGRDSQASERQRFELARAAGA